MLLRSRTGRSSALLLLVALATPSLARAGDLSRLVRLKLSAGDLASGEAAVDEYKRTKGVDPDYLDAVGWLARGAVLLGKPDRAAPRVAELRREIPAEKDETIVPYGAAIEVEGKLRAQRDGRGAAIRYLEGEYARAKDVSLRSRIRKNVNLLSLEGRPALPIAGEGAPALDSLRGKPVLVFLWAHGCGDCKAQAPILARLRERYRDRVAFVAPTRLYGTDAEWKPLADEAAERALVAKSWAEFTGLAGVPAPIDTETMVRYGASATPTIVLLDRLGIVRTYAPTRMSEEELAHLLDELLAES